ncbi:MAG TPA: M23 family metallopeptidase [Bacteroidia bacterium]|nr:M23 family metallopeptidase [Bacteroidia bacterium]
MKNNLLKFLAFLFVFTNYIQAQSPFVFPLKGKPALNGNYGEVRPNHFHAGLDFKTHYSEHLPIHAVADGYVSRIKISTTGYGKVLYVTHPNGLVSVYGHEYVFADKIKKYTEAAQEIAEVFEIELFPKPTDLPVKQDEIIGYTGNTGSSEGPHLHFEIRDEKSEAPLNPLRFFKIEDVVAPKIQRVALYSEYKLEKIILPAQKTDTIKTTYAIGFGIECFDYEQKQGNKNNIYKAEIYIDGKLYYRHILDSITFDLARYVNTYADYDLKKQKQITIQRLYKEKNNDLPIYKTVNDRGFISFNDNAFHIVRIVVYDFYNQKDEVSYIVKTVVSSPIIVRGSRKQDCLTAFKESIADYSIELPAKSLYEDVQLVTSYQNNTLSISAMDYDAPFQNSCIIKLKVPDNLSKYKDKLCVSNVSGTKSYVDAVFENGFVKANIKTFGRYKIDIDTVAPQIKFNSNKTGFYKLGNIVSFKVTDNYSGIGVFKLHLNGKWHLAEYEPKTNTIFFTVDEKVFKGNLILNLQVSDKENNQSNFQTTLLVQ